MKLKAHIVFVTGLLFVLAGEVVGQGLCDRGGGAFTVTPQEGCSPLRVTIDNKVLNTASDGVGYVVTYDGKTMQGLAFSDLLPTPAATYSIPGEFIILQRAFTNAGRTLYHCEKVLVKEGRGINISVNSCGGGKVNAVLTKDVILDAYDRIEINWGDGSDIQYWRQGDNLGKEHTYVNKNVSPTIKIRGLYDTGSCREGAVKDIPVTFQQAELTGIQVSALDMSSAGNLSFTYRGIDAIKTQVQYSADGGVTFNNGESWSIGGLNTFSIKSLSKDSPYTVRLMSVDNCGGNLPSKQITSMSLKAESSNGIVKLSWNRYPVAGDFTNYELYRNGNLIETLNDIEEVSFTDADVDCGDFVVYYVKAILAGASSKSAEESIRVDNGGSLGLVNASVSVVGEGVLISAEVPGKSYDLTIERAESRDGLFRRVMILNSQGEYLDNNNIQPGEKSYCYKLSFSSCGQQYPATPPLCTILLEKKHSTFTWSDHLPFLQPIESYAMLQTGSGGGAQEISIDSNMPYTPKIDSDGDPEYTFQIKALSDDGKLESLSNAITFKRSADVFFPTAFSPNGDFKNDDIKPIAVELASYSFTIYNRWGGVIFHTQDQTIGWDGKVKNELAELGWYIYKVDFVDDLNQKVEKRGTFMLLR
ncbi:MAG TPA: gliding motility-associated C-terminal domain-containing protein [Dyadobacter sp.]|nr:gliding motility-associated C-terminal domain-containing protein [Dyadobacter sp.]